MAIYLEYEGVKGNVTAEGYAGHIAVQSLSFGLKRGISMEPGNMSNREATRPVVNQITLKKLADISAAALFRESVTGSSGKKATLRFVQTGSGALRQFMDYSLENCLVSGYWINAGSGKQPEETIVLSFSKILVNYSDCDASNKSASPKRVGYDIAAAKPL
jgi:type VI secretion system secreted protein Hcp